MVILLTANALYFVHIKNELLLSFFRYDREEGGTIYDADSSSVFLGDEASFQKKEAELAKRLILIYMALG